MLAQRAPVQAQDLWHGSSSQHSPPSHHKHASRPQTQLYESHATSCACYAGSLITSHLMWRLKTAQAQGSTAHVPMPSDDDIILTNASPGTSSGHTATSTTAHAAADSYTPSNHRRGVVSRLQTQFPGGNPHWVTHGWFRRVFWEWPGERLTWCLLSRESTGNT